MTYDPWRNEPPLDPDMEESSTGRGRRLPTKAGPIFESLVPWGWRGPAVILFSAVLLLLATIGGYLFLYAAGPSEQNIAANDNRPPITQPSTTGAGPARETPPTPLPKSKPVE